MTWTHLLTFRCPDGVHFDLELRRCEVEGGLIHLIMSCCGRCGEAWDRVGLAPLNFGGAVFQRCPSRLNKRVLWPGNGHQQLSPGRRRDRESGHPTVRSFQLLSSRTSAAHSLHYCGYHTFESSWTVRRSCPSSGAMTRPSIHARSGQLSKKTSLAPWLSGQQRI